jgi:uncharacterized protein
LTLYLDSSALVKRYVAEDGSDEVLVAMNEAETWSSCRLGFVEAVRAVGLKAGDKAARKVKEDWLIFEVLEVDQALVERAAELALLHRLRSLDAVHLAAALEWPDDDPVFATWDARLHRAAREHGLETLPASLG